MIVWQQGPININCNNCTYDTVWMKGVTGRETAALKAPQTSQPPFVIQCSYYKHLCRYHQQTFSTFFTSQFTLRNNEETAEACILNILTLLFVAFKLLFIFFSILYIIPSQLHSRSLKAVFFTVRFTLPLLLSTHPPPPVSSPPLSFHPPAISYLPQGEAGEDTAALGAQEHVNICAWIFTFLQRRVAYIANSLHCKTLPVQV